MRRCAATLEPEMRPAELDCLLKIIRTHHFSGKHLEVGTAAGGTLWQMMASFQPEKRPPFVVIDPMGYFPNQLEVVKENLSQNGVDPKGVEFREEFSEKAVADSLSNRENFDFILVDGSHKIQRVTEDLRWAECLNVGGVLAFHDYCTKLRGVKLALDRFLKCWPQFEVIAQVDTLLVVKKSCEVDGPIVSGLDRLRAKLLTPPLQLEQSFRKRLRRWGWN